MPLQRITVSEPDTRPPWSPLTVSLITLLLPAGGAVLTIRNLSRMQQLDADSAKRLTVAAYVVFAFGITALLLSAHRSSSGLLQPDANAESLLSFGVAIASYVVQRGPYRAWRSSHDKVRPSPWLGGVGRAAAYTLVTVVGVVPLLLVALLLGLGGGTGQV